MTSSRILHPALRERVMSTEDAAALIRHGDTVGMSGFTGAGYPKATPLALARQVERANDTSCREQARALQSGC